MDRLAARGRQTRLARWCALLAISLAASGLADAHTLGALLRMPLEQLMALRITTPVKADRGNLARQSLPRPGFDGRAYER